MYRSSFLIKSSKRKDQGLYSSPKLINSNPSRLNITLYCKQMKINQFCLIVQKQKLR